MYPRTPTLGTPAQFAHARTRDRPIAECVQGISLDFGRLRITCPRLALRLDAAEDIARLSSKASTRAAESDGTVSATAALADDVTIDDRADRDV
ncbi:hypothetical protein [Streptomyces sp. NPDC003719]